VGVEKGGCCRWSCVLAERLLQQGSLSGSDSFMLLVVDTSNVFPTPTFALWCRSYGTPTCQSESEFGVSYRDFKLLYGTYYHMLNDVSSELVTGAKPPLDGCTISIRTCPWGYQPEKLHLQLCVFSLHDISCNMELIPSIQAIFKRGSLGFYLNGVKIDLADPNPQWTLLDFIRSQHGLKGTKLGCGEGGCGACTVVIQTLDSRRKGRIVHMAVNACLYPLIGGKLWSGWNSQSWPPTFTSIADTEAVIGKHVITVEGLGNAEHPHPLQERMAKLHGSQYVV
jgi:aerobic-type carbon monoxide dehydrogenase small subunit (CoxS/CutS family)